MAMIISNINLSDAAASSNYPVPLPTACLTSSSNALFGFQWPQSNRLLEAENSRPTTGDGGLLFQLGLGQDVVLSATCRLSILIFWYWQLTQRYFVFRVRIPSISTPTSKNLTSIWVHQRYWLQKSLVLKANPVDNITIATNATSSPTIEIFFAGQINPLIGLNILALVQAMAPSETGQPYFDRRWFNQNQIHPIFPVSKIRVTESLPCTKHKPNVF